MNSILLVTALVLSNRCASASIDTSGACARSSARDTQELQARIDAVSGAGGGTVCVTGDWTVASLNLRSGVTLHLEEGARLVASTNYADYVNTPGEDRGAVVCAEGATGVAIVGKGVIDGRGRDMPRVGRIPGRWRGVVFTRCKGVRIEDVTIRDAHSWGCFLKECDGVTVRRVTISNHANLNNDGLDIASKNVLVEDCDIDSEDDGVVLKNSNPDFVVENVRVRNCRISSNSSFVKIGTETAGGFRNIDIRDCELDVRVPISIRSDYLTTPGVTTLRTGGDGIAIQTVDGGFVDGVTVSDIRMKRGICVPVCIRLDRRRSRTDGGPTYLRNVTIANVTMENPSTSWLPCLVTGGSGLRPENIAFRACRFRMKGGVEASFAECPVPEKDGGYPSGRQFGVVTPAYGLYARHADGVTLDDVRFDVEQPDVRQETVFEDVAELDRLNRVVLDDGEITRIFVTNGETVVDFVLRPTSASFIRNRLALATPGAWDGRFWGCGNGGWAGKVWNVHAEGSARLSCDLGTSRTTRKDAPENAEVLKDYSWRATHLSTVAAKRLVEAYYGRKPKKCYFTGASCGGRQGLVEALRFPGDYDGIVSEVPGFTERSRTGHAWQRERLKKQYGTWFSKEEMVAVRAAELRYFATRDPAFACGKFILDPHPTPEKLDGCWREIVSSNPTLSDREALWRALFEPVLVQGEKYAPGKVIGIEFDSVWGFMLPKMFGPRTAAETTEAEMAAFGRDPDVNVSADLRAYKARGGKIIMYGGLEDLSCAEAEMRAYYELVMSLVGGREPVQEFFLYFSVPGRTHGARGEASGTGKIGKAVGLERQIVDWVESGRRPDALTFAWLSEPKTLTVTPYPENAVSCR